MMFFLLLLRLTVERRKVATDQENVEGPRREVISPREELSM